MTEPVPDSRTAKAAQTAVEDIQQLLKGPFAMAWYNASPQIERILTALVDKTNEELKQERLRSERIRKSWYEDTHELEEAIRGVWRAIDTDSKMDGSLVEVVTALVAEKEREPIAYSCAACSLVTAEAECPQCGNGTLREHRRADLGKLAKLEVRTEQVEAALAQARDGIRFHLGYSTATPFRDVSDAEVESVVVLGKDARRALSGSTDETGKARDLWPLYCPSCRCIFKLGAVGLSGHHEKDGQVCSERAIATSDKEREACCASG